jgi:hypothetical protein
MREKRSAPALFEGSLGADRVSGRAVDRAILSSYVVDRFAELAPDRLIWGVTPQATLHIREGIEVTGQDAAANSSFEVFTFWVCHRPTGYGPKGRIVQ